MAEFASFSAILWVRIERGFIRFPAVSLPYRSKGQSAFGLGAGKARSGGGDEMRCLASFADVWEEFSGYR